MAAEDRTPAAADPALATWDRLADVGTFFALRTTRPPAAAVPLAALYAGDPDPWERRLGHVASRLGTDERRVAASLAHQGLASRLWSVALAATAVLGTVPRLSPDRLYWLPEGSTPDDLWTTEQLAAPEGRERIRPPTGNPPPAGARVPQPSAADAVHRAVHTTHLAPLARTLRARTPVAPALLRGNSASALAGAGRQLIGWARRSAAPEVAERVAELTATLLHHPQVRPEWTETAGVLRRRSCCLYYRVPGGGLCGDCVLDSPPRTGRA
ncbi:(2Fe-2S)-binding protein [Streptomyces spiramenti]|uniref:Ferric iron reductase n=1 Tax=Streptomyces spiramenti TaxID=2720606 RepID=A0ABX1AI47_9ACTN|nr:(2Fe-2S)-binding protein [Streptomyces spiramenti]NJP64770.1 ferric iron reductase [Streptomyces spiramenti]